MLLAQLRSENIAEKTKKIPRRCSSGQSTALPLFFFHPDFTVGIRISRIQSTTTGGVVGLLRSLSKSLPVRSFTFPEEPDWKNHLKNEGPAGNAYPPASGQLLLLERKHFIRSKSRPWNANKNCTVLPRQKGNKIALQIDPQRL